MRWTILILNVLAAVGIVVLSAGAIHAHRTLAYSEYRLLKTNHVLVERPTYNSGEPLDVEGRLRNIAGGGFYLFAAYLGAGACLINGFVFFFAHAPRRHDSAA